MQTKAITDNSEWCKYSVELPKEDVRFFRTLAKRLGWEVGRKQRSTKNGQ